MAGGKFTVVRCSRCVCGMGERRNCAPCKGTGRVPVKEWRGHGRRTARCKPCKGRGWSHVACSTCGDTGQVVIGGPSKAAIQQLQGKLARSIHRKSWRDDTPFRF